MEKTASTPIQLFRGMTADELAALRAAHCIRVQRYDKNALIYHAGRVVHEIGIVQSGSVNVESNDLWGNKSILSHVEAGQAFAETYALCGEPLMVDVAAARKYLFSPDKYDSIHVYNIMETPPDYIYYGEKMDTVMRKFEKTGAWRLPVVDPDSKKYLGFISKSRLLMAYRAELREISLED